MAETKSQVTEVVGIFTNNEDLQNTIYELATIGFGRRKFSILASPESVKDKFGIEEFEVSKLADNEQTPRATNISPEEVEVAEGAIAGGSILASVATSIIMVGSVAVSAIVPAAIAGTSAGALIGSILAKKLGEKYDNSIERKIDEGGIILWVNISNEKEKQSALSVMSKYGANYLHTHII